MDKAAAAFFPDLLACHTIPTLATCRADGWPQATTVGYVNDGLRISVMTFPGAQKVANIGRGPRVSLTIDREEADRGRIRGLSMAALAEVVTDPGEIRHVTERMSGKFPQMREMPPPGAAEVTMPRLTPKVISILNYAKGFGHTELVVA